jgi:ketose-bisphosphate aldolase
MGLVTMTEILRKAQAGRYAVGAFNIVDYGSARVAVESAEALKAPIIVQASVKTAKFWGVATIMTWMKELAGRAAVPVAIHLDHCKEVDFIKQCLDAGWTSVMIDASAKPFAENLAATRQVVEMARRTGASVEAEMGRIVGVEDDIFVKHEDASLADPREAVEFCKGLGLAAFAPAIGTAHGIYKGEPKIALDRLEVIARQSGVPIALHGGTGLADDVFRKAIALGCAKLNISTAIKYAFIDGFVDYHAAHKEYEPLKPIGAQLEKVREVITTNIRLFGGEGKA